MKGPCANILSTGHVCGHAFAEHAPDVNFPNSLRCFHGAGDGTGCTEKYADRCKQYVEPVEAQ
jgi:hypothetical protein